MVTYFLLVPYFVAQFSLRNVFSGVRVANDGGGGEGDRETDWSHLLLVLHFFMPPISSVLRSQYVAKFSLRKVFSANDG